MRTLRLSNVKTEIDRAIPARDTVSRPIEQNDYDSLLVFRGIFWASLICAPFWIVVGWWLL
jgi:hypothetical protein